MMILALSLAPVAVAAQSAATEARRGPDFAKYISREEAIVVSIRTTRTVPGIDLGDDDDGLLPADPLGSTLPTPQATAWQPRQESRLASGFIISHDGYMMTNAHAVSGIDEAIVRLADSRQFTAQVIGLDKLTDVAVIKIEATDLPMAVIGDSARLAAGEWVVAIGSPFGLDSSVTAGIVSARQRFLPGGGSVPLIQTDVAINPGSSGGPLFNLRGEVVGINSMIFSQTGGYMGVSLAVPIDLAMKVAGQLRSFGRVVRGRLGVKIQEVTLELARSFGLQFPRGALVVRVDPSSPAERAGLRSGDVLLGLDEHSDASFGQLQHEVASTPPGNRLTVNIWRRGAVQAMLITVVEAPAELPKRSGALPVQRDLRLGLVLGELNAARRLALRIDSGMSVREVRGAALRAGIQADDVILAIGDRPVTDIDEFDTALASMVPGRPVALLVLRDGVFAFVAIPLPP